MRPMTYDSRELVKRASKGDPLAVDDLLEHHLPGLRAFIRLRAGSALRAKESASDVVQSVCLEILQHLDRFKYRGEAGFKYWLYTTALRKISKRYEYYRAAKRDMGREVRLEPQNSSVGDNAVLNCYRTFCTPSRDAMFREQIDLVESAFQQLPEDHRTVILLARIVGLSRAEIASEMGRSEGAVRSLLSRALARLAESLEQEDTRRR
ncbi:MAG: RNA polymerase sigma factor [Planctomycetota bacterium]